MFSLMFALASTLSPAIAQQQGALAASQKRFQDLYAAGNYAAAFAEAQKAEAAARRAGTNNFAYVSALNDLARANQALGNYADAARMFKQVVDALRKNLPAADPRTAQALANLATVHLLQGRNAEAEKLYKQALDTAAKALGPSNPTVAGLITNLGDVYKNQARYEEAEAQYKRALEMAERTGGPNDLQVALVLNNLTKVYEDQSRFGEVEAASKRALAIREQALGPNHPDVAASLNNLAHLYERLGRYAEADALFRRAIEIWEKSLGPKHPHLASALLNLGSVYASEERLDEAEALYKRSLGIREAVFGSNHAEVATLLNNLAQLYEAQGRYQDVEAFAKRALAIVTRALGPENPDTAKVMRKLGAAYDGQGRYREAQEQLDRALEIFSKAFGPNHRFLATVLISQGHLFEHMGRLEEANDAYRRALAINERARGANHPESARVLNDLALLSLARRDPAGALAYSRRASAAVLAHAALGDSAARHPRDGGGLIEQRASYFVNHVGSLAAAVRSGLDPSAVLGREAFEIAQWANQSAAAAAIQQLGPRFGANNDALAALVRQNQDLSAFWRDRDKALIEALSKRQGQVSAAQIDAIRRQLADTERKLADVDARLQKEFPDFAALANPKPAKVEEVQKLLAAGEALVLILMGEKEGYVFAVKPGSFEWHTIPIGREELAAKIARFRRGLDLNTMQEFDLGLANELYALLLGPLDAFIKDQGHLMIVPSGALTALPFHLLVTEKTASAAPPPGARPSPEHAAPYRDAAWLIKRQAVSILPSVASLQPLRALTRKDDGSKPMIGFGDPVFNPGQPQEGEQRGARTRGRVRAYTDYWRGAGLDRSMLANTLPQLPDTADELRAVAQALGVSTVDLHLGRAATVTAVKHAPLANYRIVYFATHGLVAGDIKGLAEPSLALSLPAHPTAEDDGLLEASEAAQLKLNADWVVLSACNTIAGERPGAEALSGLARAFFYAGARALLVSHWEVASDAATRLTTSAFAILKADPTLGRAEAMRRTMLAFLADRASPENAYPAVWGPFAVVGEGNRR
jgi:CHAT domain-containing protein/Tfp pilus assembly protein PilF